MDNDEFVRLMESWTIPRLAGSPGSYTFDLIDPELIDDQARLNVALIKKLDKILL